jgi:hypothetical protein
VLKLVARQAQASGGLANVPSGELSDIDRRQRPLALSAFDHARTSVQRKRNTLIVRAGAGYRQQPRVRHNALDAAVKGNVDSYFSIRT